MSFKCFSVRSVVYFQKYLFYFFIFFFFWKCIHFLHWTRSGLIPLQTGSWRPVAAQFYPNFHIIFNISDRFPPKRIRIVPFCIPSCLNKNNAKSSKSNARGPKKPKNEVCIWIQKKMEHTSDTPSALMP